jgi:hypothetical protein
MLCNASAGKTKFCVGKVMILLLHNQRGIDYYTGKVAMAGNAKYEQA